MYAVQGRSNHKSSRYKKNKKISTHLLIPGTDGGMVWTLFSLFFVLCPNSQLQSAKKGSDRPPPLALQEKRVILFGGKDAFFHRPATECPLQKSGDLGVGSRVVRRRMPSRYAGRGRERGTKSLASPLVLEADHVVIIPIMVNLSGKQTLLQY